MDGWMGRWTVSNLPVRVSHTLNLILKRLRLAQDPVITQFTWTEEKLWTQKPGKQNLKHPSEPEKTTQEEPGSAQTFKEPQWEKMI